MPVDLKQLAAEIVARDKTGPGVKSAAENFDKLGDAAEQTAVAVEKTTKVSASAERAWSRLQSRIDPLAKAQAKLAADTRILDRAMENGVISAGQRADAERRLQQAFQQTERRIKETERAQNGLNRSFSAGRVAVEGLKGAALGFAAAFSFRALISGTNDAIAKLDELAKKARSLGGIGEAGFLQEARFALGQQGLSQEGADKSLQRLTRNVGDLKLGTGTLRTLLPGLEGGPQLAEALKNARTVREQYELVVTALNKIPEASKRAALATAAFGKEAGANIGAIAEGGVEEFEKLSAEARAAGLVIETDLLERSEVLNDRLAKAGQIISTQMSKVFLSLGPIIAYLAEASAKFLKKLVEGVDDVLNRTRNIQKTTEASELRGVVRTANSDITKFEAARDRNILPSTPRSAAAEIRANFQIDIDRAVARRAEAQQRINDLLKEQGVSYDDLVGKIVDVASASEDAGQSLIDLEEKRNQTLARLAAARQGRGALEAFDAKAEIDKAVADSGTVGKAQEAFRKVAEEIAKADAETAKLIKSWGGAAKAAKEISFDPFGDLDAQNERLQALVDAAALGEEELKAARTRFDIEDQIARLKLEAAKANKSLTDDEIRQLEEKLNLNRQLADSLSSREGEIARAARGFADPFGHELDRVADDFIERLARGDASAFRNLGRQLKDILFSVVLDPFKQAFANILRGIFSGAADLFEDDSPAVIGSAALGFGGLALGGGSSAFGLASLIGPGALGRFGAGLGNFLGLGGNITGGLSKALAGAGTFGGALGGIGGSVLSGALFGKSTGQSIGSTVGGIAGNLIPVPVLGPLLGSFIGGAIGSLFSKTPKSAASIATSGGGLSVGASFGVGKGRQDQALSLAGAVVDSLSKIASIIDADIRSGLSLGSIGTRKSNFIFDPTGANRTKGSGVQSFGSPEEAVAAAIKSALSRGALDGPAELVAAAKALAASGKEIDDVVSRLATLKDVLKDPTEIIDPLKAQIDALVDAFEGLDVTTGELKAAFDGAIDKLAARTREALSREILAGENPLLVQIQDLLKAQAAQRSAIADLGAKGGNVDSSLVDEFQRRQILNQFNIADRLAQATDPLKFSFDQFLKGQAQELAALTAAVDGIRIRQSDVDALQRAQGAERSQFFSQLSEQDLLKLGGQAGLLDLVEAFGGRIAVVLTQINDEFRRQIEEYDQTLDQLRTRVSTLAGQRQSFDAALFSIDRDFFAGTPGQQVDSLRATVADLRQRALTGTDEDKAFAREQLPGVVQSLLQGSERLSGRGLQFQNDLAFGKSALETVRAQIADEEALAQRQLDTLIASRDIQEDMRDLLAQQTLDRTAFAALVGRLDPSNPLAALSADLLSLTAAQAEQNADAAAALAAITPSSIGLTAPVLQPSDPAPSSALATSAASAPAPATSATSNTSTPAREADVINALFQNNRTLQALVTAIATEANAQRSRDNTQTEILAQISSSLRQVA